MKTLSSLTLALLIATLIGNSQALTCYVGMEENKEVRECYQEELHEGTRFVCSSAEFGGRTWKTCQVEGQLQEIVGNDRCENMTMETYLRWQLKTSFPSFIKRQHPYGNQNKTVDQFVSLGLKKLRAYLVYNATVCSCTTTLCNFDEQGRKRSGQSGQVQSSHGGEGEGFSSDYDYDYHDSDEIDSGHGPDNNDVKRLESGNSTSLKCHVCMPGNCKEQHCSQEEGQELIRTKFVCSSAYVGVKAVKSCEVEEELNELIGGNDKCKTMSLEKYLKWNLPKKFPMEKRRHPEMYGEMTEEQYVVHGLQRSMAFLKFSVTVCSCSAELCNSDEEDKIRIEEQDRRDNTEQNATFNGSHQPNSTRNPPILRESGNHFRNLLLSMEELLFRFLGWPY